jgi:glucokinase
VTADQHLGWTIGIDVGGTKCLAVAVDASDPTQVVARRRLATPPGHELADTIVALVDDLTTEMGGAMNAGADELKGVGIGVAGLVTLDGVVRASPNLSGVHELRLGDELTRRGLATWWIGNDNTAATFGEWKLGAGRGVDELVYVGLGTGIGGGFVNGGRLHVGQHGFAGEIGHMVVDPNGVECVCGRRGCWERYASGAGLRWCASHRGVDVERSEVMTDRARAGDQAALAVLDDFGRWVALGLANLVNVADPAMVILGGGVLDAADVIMPPIRAWLDRLLYSPNERPMPEVLVAALGSDAGAIGAAHAMWLDATG